MAVGAHHQQIDAVALDPPAITASAWPGSMSASTV